MPVNPNATNTIIFAGLALSHYNRHTDLWEVLFIRDQENLHDLKMLIGYGEANPQEVKIDFKDEIVVTARNAVSKSARYEPTPTFTRNIRADDEHDLRWMLNFSSKEMHDHPVTTHKGERNNLLTVSNALFYTSKLSDKDYNLQKKQDGSNVGSPVSLPAIGEDIGADIEYDSDGGLTIEVKKATGSSKKYEVAKGSIVFFNNICDPTNPKCDHDFPHYYEVISDHGETFDLILRPKMRKKSDDDLIIRGAVYSCEGAVVDEIIPDPPGSLINP